MGGSTESVGPEWMQRPAGFPVPEQPSAPVPCSPLQRAEAIDPGNPFVSSCRKFFTERGYLSAKQVAALNAVTPTRKRGVGGFDVGKDPEDLDRYWEGQAEWYDLTIGG